MLKEDRMAAEKTWTSGGPAAAPMLRRVRDLQSYTMGATDGDIGRVDDLYFDDQGWTVRHLVIDTGGWLTGRRVLIPPRAVQNIDVAGQRLVTNLTRRQVEESPGLDSDRPVSRPYERDLYTYYGYPHYWAGPYLWGPITYPTAPPPATYDALAAGGAADPSTGDTHLRSARDVTGHGIHATDGELGHVEDYLVDEVWSFRYLIVDPRNWWPGHHVLISTDWITAVHWNDSTVQVSVDKEAVRNAPAYDPAGWVDRNYETRYYEHYGRPAYWQRRPESWRRYPPAA
jgi:hypothetical protein